MEAFFRPLAGSSAPARIATLLAGATGEHGSARDRVVDRRPHKRRGAAAAAPVVPPPTAQPPAPSAPDGPRAAKAARTGRSRGGNIGGRVSDATHRFVLCYPAHV